MEKLLTIFVLALGIVSVGCVTRVVVVPTGDPVQIRREVKADVWIFDSKGQRTPATVKIPAGWYALPDEVQR
jgi:hypothetical protein